LSVFALTVMVTPIMTALITEALGSVPRSWHEGAIALGLSPLRATIAVSLRRDPPGDHRRDRARDRTRNRRGNRDRHGLGRQGVQPQPRRRLIFIFEPLRTLASEIIDQAEGLSEPALRSSIYASRCC